MNEPIRSLPVVALSLAVKERHASFSKAIFHYPRYEHGIDGFIRSDKP